MTRETRIALLVGLAFIVLFGLVLGRRSLSLSEDRERAAALPQALPAPAPSPELAAARLNEQDDRPVLAPAPRSPAAPGTAPGVRPAPAGVVEPPVALVARTPDAPPTDSRAAAAAASGQTPQPQPSPQPQARARSGREVRRFGAYKVRPGDSLIKIARRVYGPQHEREYLRIFQANRDRLTDASRLRVGQVLKIPPLPGRSAPAGGACSAGRGGYAEMTLAELARHFRGGRTYVVRPGDSLTAIARKMMGRATRAAVRKLLQANRDRIRDPDRLPVGLRLRIPG